ncbi:tetratricopeptide repeat protein [Myxococcota bacterium]|nr:tetratricopeptide repeat protein [Myxococcota bacterium]
MMLVGTLLLAYWGGLSGPFLYDDRPGIVNNESIRSLWPLSTSLNPPRDQPHSGRPVANLSLALSYALGGTDPTGYRAFNLLLHIGSTLLVFGGIRRALSSPFVSRVLHPSARLLAFTTALLWGVHPLVSEVIFFAMQRTEAMMGFFYLLTFYAVVRASEGRSVFVWSIVAVIACAAGMGSKASMVTAPVLIFFFDRAFLTGSFATTWKKRCVLYVTLASTWSIVIALQFSNPRSLSTEFFDVDYLSFQPEMLGHYFRNSIWPEELVLDYGPMVSELAPGFTWGAAVVLILVAVAMVLAFKSPRLGFVGAWIFGTLAPTSSIISIFTEIGAERRMYLALIALVALVVVGAHLAMQRILDDRGKSPVLRRAIATMLVVCVALAFVYRTRDRAIEFSDVLSIWQRTLRQRPANPRAYLSVGNELRDRGRVAEAVPFYERAITLDSGYMEARNNLGVSLLMTSRPGRAVTVFEAAVADYPRYAYLHHNLARALVAEGRFTEAVQQYLEELEIQPTLVSSMREAAWILSTHWDARIRDGSESLRLARRAYQLDPSDVETLDTLSAAEAEAGDFDLAIDLSRRALETASRRGRAYPYEDRMSAYRLGKPYRSSSEGSWRGPGR